MFTVLTRCAPGLGPQRQVFVFCGQRYHTAFVQPDQSSAGELVDSRIYVRYLILVETLGYNSNLPAVTSLPLLELSQLSLFQPFYSARHAANE